MKGDKKIFLSYPNHDSRFLSASELLKRKSRRVIAAELLADGDAEVTLRGNGFWGTLLWSDAQNKPLSLAYLDRTDVVHVTEMLKGAVHESGS